MVCSPPFLKLGNGYKDCASRPKFSGTGLSDALVICDTCHRYARWLPCLRKRDQVFPIFFPIYTHVTRCLRQVIWTTHRLWRGSKSERTYFPSWRVLIESDVLRCNVSFHSLPICSEAVQKPSVTCCRSRSLENILFSTSEVRRIVLARV